jgi:plastocyanin
MKRSIVSALTVAVLAAACAIPALGATKTVLLKDNRFSPTSTTISKGSSITFKWAGHAPHNVIGSGPSSFHSSTKTKGTYTKRFTRRGTYRLVCSIHAPEMKMRVTVK